MRQQDVKFLKCSVNILSNDLYKLAFSWTTNRLVIQRHFPILI